LPSVIDENAFGIWLAYYDVEDDEYAEDETASFVRRFQAFETSVLGYLAQTPIAERTRALCLGHGVYIEFEDGDETTAVMPWVRGLRSALETAEFTTVAVLTHGSRWIAESEQAEREQSGPITVDSAEVSRFSRPSEPLRRALYADAATRPDELDEERSWGPGFYVDVDAIEALGKAPKNAPTVLTSGGAGFYRVSR
jgi:hypothetical protein